MIFEHFALNVSDPVAMADWYVAHCGMIVRRQVDTGSKARWIADSTGRLCLEVYGNPIAAVPDYASQHELVFHFAFAVADAVAVRDRLLAAGATLLTDDRLPDGSVLMMLRDPWGVAIQLCQRAQPF